MSTSSSSHRPIPADDLAAAARDVAARARAPYSGFRVGCAVATDAGMFVGCNVENASYGLTICAERAAMVAAVSGGATTVYHVHIHVDGDDGAPCGACRQFIAEFNPEAQITFTYAGELCTRTAAELLPMTFLPGALDGASTTSSQ